jgi:Xaa-Pro aminopeptidase
MTPFVASGEHMAPPHRICSDKLIRHGDVVFIDIGAAWGGYFGDMARTVVCGEASEEQKRTSASLRPSLAPMPTPCPMKSERKRPPRPS